MLIDNTYVTSEHTHQFLWYYQNRYHIGITLKEKKHKWLVYAIYEALFTIQTLGRRDLSGCFVVHICGFYSSYSSYFAFLCTSSKIFRAILEPALIFQDLIQIS